MTRQILGVSLAALLAAGGVGVAQAQQGQQVPGAPGAQQEQQRGPGTMQHPGGQQAQPGGETQATGERGRGGMRDMQRMQRMMMQGGMSRHHGMRGKGRHAMRGMGGPGMMHPHMLRMMIILLDTDGDGTLSLEEVQAVTERFFNAMDGNGDGQLTQEEIRAFYMPVPGPAAGYEGADDTDGADDDDTEADTGTGQPQ